MQVARLGLARSCASVVLALLIAVPGILSVVTMRPETFPSINIPVVNVCPNRDVEPVVSAFRHWSIDRHDTSARSSRQKKKLAAAELPFHLCSSYVAAPHINRYPQSQTLWLVGSMLAVPLEAADHRRNSVPPLLFYKRFRSLSKKQLDYHELKDLEANDG
jgi:hypothetical protein